MGTLLTVTLWSSLAAAPSPPVESVFPPIHFGGRVDRAAAASSSFGCRLISGMVAAMIKSCGPLSLSLVASSSLLLVACEEERTPDRQLPCTVTDAATIPEGVDEPRFIAYFIDEVAGGLICMPGDPVGLDTCQVIFNDCIATIEGPVGEATTFTIGIENRSFQGDILVSGLQFGEGTDPSFTVQPLADGVVAPGAARQITVTFSPGAEGEVSGTLAILSNASNVDGGADTVIQLRGTGLVP